MKQQKFTLLELLIVSFLLAVLAGGVVMSVSNVYSESNETLAKSRASTVYKALVKFKKDTGFYPKQGQLALSEVENPAPAGLSEDSGIWFDRSENFNQLFELPVETSGNSLTSKWKWNIDSKRGWDGPYLNNGLYTEDDSTFTSSVNTGVISRDRILAYVDNFDVSHFFRLVEDSTTTPSTFFLVYELDGTDEEIQLP